mmetsp:Transcript_25574/g.59250  ORF Transcript_25574/g.59250 Transcript_25574/m.59250 type:complete len:95 (+) Transcript_25574:563-847(+)
MARMLDVRQWTELAAAATECGQAWRCEEGWGAGGARSGCRAAGESPTAERRGHAGGSDHARFLAPVYPTGRPQARSRGEALAGQLARIGRFAAS